MTPQEREEADRRIVELRARLARRDGDGGQHIPEEAIKRLGSGKDFPRRPKTGAPILTPGQTRLWNALGKYKSLCARVMSVEDPPMVKLFYHLTRLDRVPDEVLELVADQILEEQQEIVDGCVPKPRTPPSLACLAAKCLAAMNMTTELDLLSTSPKTAENKVRETE